MAYAFGKTMNALGQKQDIFNPQGMALDDADGAGGQGSNAEGDLSGGAGGTNTGESVKQSNDVSSNAAVSANIGRVKSPADIKNLRASVDTTKSKLQQEADSYVAGVTGPKALSEGDKINLRMAVDSDYARGDESAFAPQGVPVGGPGEAAKNTIEYWAGQNAQSVKAVDPFKTDTQTSNQTIENLGTDAGIQNLLRRTGGAEYNAGEAAFDRALLSRDSGFQSEREDLLSAYGGLQNFGDELGDKTSKAGQDSANQAYGDYLGNLRGTLEGWNLDYQDAGRAREKTIEDQASRDLFDLKAGSAGAAAASVNELKNDPANAEFKDFVADSGFDYGNYFESNYDPNQYGWQDYIGEDEAGTFNNIMGLLGKKDLYTPGAKAGGYKKEELGSFDRDRFKGDVTARAQSEFKTAQEAAAAKAAEQEAAAAAAAEAAEQEAAAAAAAKVEEDRRAGESAGSGVFQGQLPADKLFKAGPAPLEIPGGLDRANIVMESINNAIDPKRFTAEEMRKDAFDFPNISKGLKGSPRLKKKISSWF